MKYEEIMKKVEAKRAEEYQKRYDEIYERINKRDFDSEIKAIEVIAKKSGKIETWVNMMEGYITIKPLKCNYRHWLVDFETKLVLNDKKTLETKRYAEELLYQDVITFNEKRNEHNINPKEIEMYKEALKIRRKKRRKPTLGLAEGITYSQNIFTGYDNIEHKPNEPIKCIHL